MFLEPALGSAFFAHLQTAISGGSLTPDETALIENYITDVMLWATMAELALPITYQTFAKGVQQKTAAESVAPTQQEVFRLMQHYKDRAEPYKQRLINYLVANYIKFPLYWNYVVQSDTIHPEANAYECPIYLDNGVENIHKNYLNGPANNQEA